MQELVERLKTLCESAGVDKFSAEEIVELLEDGEEVEWILEQVGQAADSPIGDLLQQIAAQAAPQVSDDGEDGEGGEPAGEEDVEAGDEGDFDPTDLNMEDLEGMLPPGVDMGQVQKMLASPRGALLADFGAFCQEHGVEMDAGQGEMNEAMQELHEEWLQTPRESLEGKKTEDGYFQLRLRRFAARCPRLAATIRAPAAAARSTRSAVVRRLDPRGLLGI